MNSWLQQGIAMCSEKVGVAGHALAAWPRLSRGRACGGGLTLGRDKRAQMGGGPAYWTEAGAGGMAGFDGAWQLPGRDLRGDALLPARPVGA